MSLVLDETRIQAFIERVVDEIGAAVNVPLTVIGGRLDRRWRCHLGYYDGANELRLGRAAWSWAASVVDLRRI